MGYNLNNKRIQDTRYPLSYPGPSIPGGSWINAHSCVDVTANITDRCYPFRVSVCACVCVCVGGGVWLCMSASALVRMNLLNELG